MSDAPIRLSRRGFLQQAGAGALVSHVAAGAAAAQRVPEPPGRKLGWAVVGLGWLAINQILPAFAKCEKSRVTALVSGSPEKAQKLAISYGVAEKNIYYYENYDSIRDNPAIDIVYIVLPNGMHAEYTVRAAQAGQARSLREADGEHAGRLRADDRRLAPAQRKLMVAYRVRLRAVQQGADQGGARPGVRPRTSCWRITASTSATRPSGG